MADVERYLDGKVAIVTGAAQGNGAAIAVELARRGADIVATDVKAETLAATVDGLGEHGVRAIDIASDAASLSDLAEAFDRTISEFGRLDILVNNAGIVRYSQFPNVSVEDYDEVMALNTRGLYFAMQEAATCMADGGRIVNISSVAGVSGFASFVPYAGSKAAVIAMTKAVARLLAPRKITVNAIAPGLIDTEINRVVDQKIGVEQLGLEPGERLTSFARGIPLGEMGTPEDIAGAVGYLCSPAARYVTGETPDCFRWLGHGLTSLRQVTPAGRPASRTGGDRTPAGARPETAALRRQSQRRGDPNSDRFGRQAPPSTTCPA